jgi:hypothetical protein
VFLPPERQDRLTDQLTVCGVVLKVRLTRVSTKACRPSPRHCCTIAGKKGDVVVEKSADGGFTERPHFRGSYKYKNRTTVVAQSDGFPPQPPGILTIVSENELKQSGGDALRSDLVYRRVAGE